MNISRKKYPRYAAAHAPKSDLFRDCARAFLVGGLICAVGEGLTETFMLFGATRDDAGLVTSVCLIFASALLTALGVYDKLASAAGAGTLLPITGFANSVVSSAIDSRDEGLVLGVGAKIFNVAGPVLLYGTLAGTIYGIIYWITTL